MQVYPRMYSGNNKVGIMERLNTSKQNKKSAIECLNSDLCSAKKAAMHVFPSWKVFFWEQLWLLAHSRSSPFLHDWRHYWVGVVTIFISGGPKLLEQKLPEPLVKGRKCLLWPYMPNVLFSLWMLLKNILLHTTCCVNKNALRVSSRKELWIWIVGKSGHLF